MYVIIDIETTGGKFNEEGITEIAIHRFDGEKVVDQFISLVNPEKEIQPFVVNLTGINNKMLRTAPKFYEVAKRIVEITTDAIIVAHNAQFDYRILRTEFRRLGFDYMRKTICTVELSKQLLPDKESYSLGKLVRSLGIPVTDRHRANGDALATIKLFKLLLEKDIDKTIVQNVIKEGAGDELSQKQLTIIDGLPSETGVFYIHDKNGDIIAAGHSTDIKKRVNKHFTSNAARSKKIQKEVKTVSFDKTGSELIALLKEHAFLKRSTPKYNPRPKPYNFSHVLYLRTDEQGYQRFEIGRAKEHPNYITSFTSEIAGKNFIHKATLAHHLCSKVNGLSEAKHHCSRYETNDCYGACIQKESPENYNARVQEVIAIYSILGRTELLVDKGRNVGEHSIILVENGEFKGIGYYELNHQITKKAILDAIITPMPHGKDVRHIIENYLRTKRIQKIIPLT